MGYDSLRLELRYRHIWQTKWGTGAGSVAANQVSMFSICFLIVGMGRSQNVKKRLVKIRIFLNNECQNPIGQNILGLKK